MTNIQKILEDSIKAERAEEMKTSDQLTVGELILKLEAVDGGLPIYFDDKKYRPSGIESWRGSYCELALTYEGGGSINSEKVIEVVEVCGQGYKVYERIDTTLPSNPKVKDLLEMLRDSIGKTMEGYKGGNFLIGKTTPVWVANYGDSGGYIGDDQAVVGVRAVGSKAILQTRQIDY